MERAPAARDRAPNRPKRNSGHVARALIEASRNGASRKELADSVRHLWPDVNEERAALYLSESLRRQTGEPSPRKIVSLRAFSFGEMA